MKVWRFFTERPLCLQGTSLKTVTLTNKKQRIRNWNIADIFAEIIFQSWFDDMIKGYSKVIRTDRLYTFAILVCF